MRVNTPHFLLFSESRSSHNRRYLDSPDGGGRWRFVLESLDGETKLEVADDEDERDASRLELLAVVRGLEALDQPSRVTLVTPSRYVTHGLRFGLDQWRENDWQWERFGEMERVKNWDLWQRIDRAMRFHQVDCRVWRFDMAESGPSANHLMRLPPSLPAPVRDPWQGHNSPSAQVHTGGIVAACGRILWEMLQRCWLGQRRAMSPQAA